MPSVDHAGQRASSPSIENLTVTGTGLFNLTGDDLNNILTGNASVNTLTGNDGNDILDGGLGNDILDGGTATTPTSSTARTPSASIPPATTR